MKNSRRILALVMAVGVDFRAQAGDTNPGHVHYQPRAVEVSRSASFVTSSGAIAVVGYNDMRQMLEAMVALFVAAHPNVRFELDLRGTRFAPAALAAGTSAFAPMGGEFTPRQLNEYRAATGSDPMPFRVVHASLNPRALSGPLAIFVHRDNPLRWLTMAQAARAFSGEAARWGDLGAAGTWADRPIHPYGIKPDAVLGIFAQTRVLEGRQFGKMFVGFPQSSDVVEKISKDSSGIGFAAANRVLPSVIALALSPGLESQPVAPTVENIMAGRYPLDRFLLIYARRPLAPLVREFLRLALSREGQEIVAASPQGYLPLSPAEAAVELSKLE
jgi:phosphate transport system substrate-binding protein